jgi:hypothetical protein
MMCMGGMNENDSERKAVLMSEWRRAYKNKEQSYYMLREAGSAEGVGIWM